TTPLLQHSYSLSALSLCFFFFYCYVDLRDLHSFPTRRSSDLRSTADRTSSSCRWRPGKLSMRRCRTARRWKRCSRARACSVAARSEEHTSELQSLAYLVCRLLLEKKKKKKSTTRTETIRWTGA